MNKLRRSLHQRATDGFLFLQPFARRRRAFGNLSFLSELLHRQSAALLFCDVLPPLIVLADNAFLNVGQSPPNYAHPSRLVGKKVHRTFPYFSKNSVAAYRWTPREAGQPRV
jgi:hypothetical protein